MRSETMQGTNLSFFHLLKGSLRSIHNLIGREMIAGPEGCDHVFRSLGQLKKLRAKPLLHFGGSFIRKSEGHDFCDGDGSRLSHEEIEDTIDENRGLAGSGSCDYDDIAIAGCLCQESILRVRECELITHRVLSVFSSGARLGLAAIDTSATRP